MIIMAEGTVEAVDIGFKPVSFLRLWLVALEHPVES